MKTQEIKIPASKSLTNRAFLLAALSAKPVTIQQPLESDDTLYMFQALRVFGVESSLNDKGEVSLKFPQEWQNPTDPIFIGNAGTAARFLAAMSLVVPFSFRLEGDEYMQKRPQAELFEALRHLGVKIECHNQEEKLPATFHGVGGYPLTNELEVSGNLSSQFISALLLVAPRIQDGLTLKMKDIPVSQSYIDMSVELLKTFGVRVEVSNDKKEMKVWQGIKNAPEAYTIPADMSSASYPLAWSCLTKKPVTIINFGTQTLQGDEGFVDIIEEMGARITRNGDALTVLPPKKLKAFGTKDFSGMQDVSMTAMVLAICAEGESKLTGLENIRVKECDRLRAMVDGFKALGISYEADEQSISIKGSSKLLTPSPQLSTINSHDDHRIAMCFGVLRSALNLNIDITNPECVAKTWPRFWLELAELDEMLRTVSASIIKRTLGVEDLYLVVQKPRKENAWQFPQGGVDEGENPLKAAGRELMEECGTDIHVKYLGGRPLGSYKYFFPGDFQRWQEKHGTEAKVWLGAKVSFYYADYIDGEVEVDGEELIDHKWLRWDEIQEIVSPSYWDAIKDLRQVEFDR